MRWIPASQTSILAFSSFLPSLFASSFSQKPSHPCQPSDLDPHSFQQVGLFLIESWPSFNASPTAWSASQRHRAVVMQICQAGSHHPAHTMLIVHSILSSFHFTLRSSKDNVSRLIITTSSLLNVTSRESSAVSLSSLRQSNITLMLHRTRRSAPSALTRFTRDGHANPQCLKRLCS